MTRDQYLAILDAIELHTALLVVLLAPNFATRVFGFVLLVVQLLVFWSGHKRVLRAFGDSV